MGRSPVSAAKPLTRVVSITAPASTSVVSLQRPPDPRTKCAATLIRAGHSRIEALVSDSMSPDPVDI